MERLGDDLTVGPAPAEGFPHLNLHLHVTLGKFPPLKLSRKPESQMGFLIKVIISVVHRTAAQTGGKLFTQL